MNFTMAWLIGNLKVWQHFDPLIDDIDNDTHTCTYYRICWPSSSACLTRFFTGNSIWTRPNVFQRFWAFWYSFWTEMPRTTGTRSTTERRITRKQGPIDHDPTKSWWKGCLGWRRGSYEGFGPCKCKRRVGSARHLRNLLIPCLSSYST